MGTLLVRAALCRHTAQTHSSHCPTPLSQALGAPTCSIGQLQEALHLTVWTVLAVDALAQDGAGDLGLITLAVVLQAARALAVTACYSNTTPVAQTLPCALPRPNVVPHLLTFDVLSLGVTNFVLGHFWVKCQWVALQSGLRQTQLPY